MEVRLQRQFGPDGGEPVKLVGKSKYGFDNLKGVADSLIITGTQEECMKAQRAAASYSFNRPIKLATRYRNGELLVFRSM